MTATMSTSARLRAALAEKNIRSGRELAEYLESKGEIYFIRGEEGWENARAELRYWEDGRRQKRVYRPTLGEYHREECVNQAKEEAAEILGVDSWSRSPFSNCWLPSEDVSRVHEKFDPARG
jgi:hypothetical protein